MIFGIVLREIVRAGINSLVYHRIQTSVAPPVNVTPQVSPTLGTLVGAHLMGEALAHPRRTLGNVAEGITSVAGGIGAVAHVVTGNQPEVDVIQRSATELLQDAAIDISRMSDAVNSLNEVVSEQLRSLTNNQRTGVILCTILPFLTYWGINAVQKPASQRVMREALEVLASSVPSKEDIAKTVREELSSRDKVTRNVVLTFTTQGLLICLICIAIVLLLIMLKNKENDSRNDSSQQGIRKY